VRLRLTKEYQRPGATRKFGELTRQSCLAHAALALQEQRRASARAHVIPRFFEREHLGMATDEPEGERFLPLARAPIVQREVVHVQIEL
jgi:hypothetical protein